MIGRYPSEIVRVTSVVLAPFILLFGLYVIAHGHYGPGGGFAGGVALAVGVILLRLVAEPEWVEAVFPPAVGLVAGAVGMLLFILIGMVPLVAGGGFLEYAATPLPVDAVDLRYFGILVVEVAVGLAVFGTLLVVFDVISGRRSTEGSDSGQEGDPSSATRARAAGDRAVDAGDDRGARS